MKILQVSAYFYPHIGGSEKYCYGLSKELADRGHEVHVLTSKLIRKSKFNEKIDGFYVHRYPSAGVIWKSNPATFIIPELKRSDADVIHSHSYIFLTSFQASLVRRFLNKSPHLLHLHGGIDVTSPPNDYSTRIKLLIKQAIYDKTIGNFTVKNADALASVSRRDMDLAEKIWGVNRDNLFWVPNALDPNEFNNDGYKDSLNVVFIGRLEAWKGLSILSKVAEIIGKERNDVKFIVIGDGSMRNYIEMEASRLGNIDVLGFVRRETIKSVLSNASVFVLPSYCMEGLPTVCLEAMSSGVPIVASRVGGVPEVVIDKETGYLFPPGDSKLCADRLLRILADEPLRNRMGRHGRRLVEQFYTWERVVEKVERIYEKIGG